ncbi:MAG: TrkA family potassium uptake protein [Eubacteriales bacterium]|jgi:trk system potassium uptake protein TrkA|nr:TrkA family potassium uptake protein [Eubacteriales bacterium]
MKSYAVIGAGRFGLSVAKTLYKLGAEVLVIDRNEEIIQNISDEVTHAVVVRTLDEQTLRSLGILNFDVVVVGIGDELEASVLVSLLLKEMGVKHVVSKATGELHAKLLHKIGVDKVVLPERDMGIRIANQLVNTHVLDNINLSPEFSIAEITPPDKWIGKSLVELSLRAKYGINVIAIKNEQGVRSNPHPEYMVRKNDILAVSGDSETIISLVQEKL